MIYFPHPTKMFQFGWFPPYTYVLGIWYWCFTPIGCPIQKSVDITPMCGSPQLIAAYHVFHRLLVPRHSLCALSNLTNVISALLTLLWTQFPYGNHSSSVKSLRDFTSKVRKLFSTPHLHKEFIVAFKIMRSYNCLSTINNKL